MKKNKGWFYRFLDGVERVGNKLPNRLSSLSFCR